jgi:UDP-N-acetylmuramoylalanine--D-glutamate ligase
MFFRFAKPTVVGITGSKGKTTTSTLIYEMLKAGGKNTCLIGNIGVPVFEKADEDEGLIAVIEMSSHQLEFTKASPFVAVLVNIYEEHLDHYKTGFDGYANSKLNITRYQTENDFFVYNNEQDVGHGLDIESAIGGKRVKVGFSVAQKSDFVNELWQSTEHLKGEHNRQDIAYAVEVARIFSVDDNSIREAIKNFKGIEHRMEFVGKFKEVSYYNDSIATIPTAVMGAIKALKSVDTLIFGGLDRGIDYKDFIEYLIESDIKNLIGLPETGHSILDEVKLRNENVKVIYARDMEDAVKNAVENTKENGICLFSPAAASYNFYKNFEEKGRHFKELVVKYAQ